MRFPPAVLRAQNFIGESAAQLDESRRIFPFSRWIFIGKKITYPSGRWKLHCPREVAELGFPDRRGKFPMARWLSSRRLRNTSFQSAGLIRFFTSPRELSRFRGFIISGTGRVHGPLAAVARNRNCGQYKSVESRKHGTRVDFGQRGDYSPLQKEQTLRATYIHSAGELILPAPIKYPKCMKHLGRGLRSADPSFLLKKAALRFSL